MTDALTPVSPTGFSALSPSREVAAMRAVLDVSRSVAASLDLDALLDRVLDAIARLVPSSRASITLDVPGRDILRIVKVRGAPDYVADMTGAERPIRGSITGRAYERREPYLVDDMLSPEWRGRMFLPANDPNRHAEERSGLFMPFVADRCVGVAFLARRGAGQFTGEDLHILSLFAPLVAIAVTNARQYAAVQEQAQGLSALLGANERFAQYRHAPTSSTRSDAIRLFAEVARDVVRHSDTQAWRVDDAGEWARNVVHLREGESVAACDAFRVGEGTLGAIVRHGQPTLLNEPPALEQTPHGAAGVETSCPPSRYRVAVPLVPLNGPRGMLVIGRDDLPFTADEFTRAQIAAQQAVSGVERAIFTATLHRQNAALIAAGKHKDAFFTHMSHELRTPLNAVIGFAQLLAEGAIEDEEDRREAYLDIRESGQHLLTVVNHVLDVARIESGQEHIACVPTPLAPILATTERICAPLFAAKAQRFALHAPDPMPVALADADRLRQVLLNLLANAQKFTPDGGAVSVAVSPAADGCVRIAVADTGIGIAPEHQSLVFEAFQQVESGYTRTQGGTGLGLALTKRLVELMGGTITLASTPGAGSTFTVTLRSVS